ncbi:MAG: tRNA pseudouridine(55) synthase TruB [Actinobacteria bacterium]|nr:tRNA pseudouridine(55) synthase TruB [Actinomycetota bacterium]
MARRRPPTVHGVCIVDKPAGVTSHDVVQELRRRLGERRVGHAGTLDPDATGVLVVAVGLATRLLTFVSGQEKTYTAEIVLGVETDTLDAAGSVTARHDMGPVDLAETREVVASNLTGEIMQVPPMVSALRVDGRRLHELAREGIEVEREARPVTVHRFDVIDEVAPGVLSVSVTCSAGTYIRSLASDLGRLLGGGAHLRNLRRTAIGSFTEDRADGPESCPLLPIATAVEHLEAVSVDADTAARVRLGQVLERFDGNGPWAVSGPDGELLAVYEVFRDRGVKPAVVLATGDR